jgi:hypothetical protein
MRSPLFRPRLRPQATRSPIFTIAPGRPEDGDPRHPRELVGVAVNELIRVRDDAPGALVVLADGRYAITGRVLVAGHARQLKRYLRLELRRSDSEAERRWLREVKDELARRSPRPLRLTGEKGLGPGQTFKITKAPSRRKKLRPSSDDVA